MIDIQHRFSKYKRLLAATIAPLSHGPLCITPRSLLLIALLLGGGACSEGQRSRIQNSVAGRRNTQHAPTPKQLDKQAVDRTPGHPAEPKESMALRNVNWGMTMEEVKKAERGVLKKADQTSLTFDATSAGMPCVIYYEFTAGLLTKAVIAFLHPAQPDLPTHGETRSLQCYRELKGLLSLKYGNGKEATRKEKPAYDVRRLAWKMKKAEESLDYYEDRYQSTREEAYLKYNNAMRDIQKAEDEDRITDNAYYTLALRRKQTRDKAVAEARSRIDEAKKTLSAVRKERIAEVWASISTDWSVANDSTIQLELSRCSGGFRLLATYEGRTGTAIGAVTSDL